MTIVVLAVHDVCSPREQTDIRDSLDGFAFGVDYDNRMRRRFGKVDVLVRRISRGGFELDIRTDLDAASRSERLHVVDVDEPTGRADDECLSSSEVHTGHVWPSRECGRHPVRLEIDD